MADLERYQATDRLIATIFLQASSLLVNPDHRGVNEEFLQIGFIL